MQVEVLEVIGRFSAWSTYKVRCWRESESSKESKKSCKKWERHGNEHGESHVEGASDKPEQRWGLEP